MIFRGEKAKSTMGISNINPLNAELNPICHLLALLGPHHILHVSRIRVNPVACPPLPPPQKYSKVEKYWMAGDFTRVVCVIQDRGGPVVKVLGYKSQGHCFDSRWRHWDFY